MTTYARITSTGTVAELITHDPAGRYHASLTWIEVPEALEDWLTPRWTYDSDTETFTPADGLDTLVSTAADRLADIRYEHQTAGAVYDGHTYHTDTEGRQSLTGAVVGAQAYEATNGEGTFSTTWKTMDGFVTLDLTGLIAAGQAVLAYVQACFVREAEILAALENAAAADGATAETVVAVYTDAIDTGWPDDEEES